ncbi:MAG: S49 family peptidase [Gammaproteobacteria bacterium]|jgi:protease-4|nr:S49 family peptidase [Gammaproteobacteria bacterium]
MSDELNAEKSIKKYEAMVEKLAFAAVTEQRKKRLWRTFWIFLTFLYLTPLVIATLNLDENTFFSVAESTDKHTAKVTMSGVIMPDSPAGAESIIKGLQKAFENEKTAGVVLEINSPGGSPVQSAYIYDEIRRLKSEHENINLFAVVEDVAASGGYFVASAADKIFVNKSSMVGSIGVRMDNFGAVDLIKKLGIERRLLTAGKHKGLLDPFLPVDEDQANYIKSMLKDVHQNFITAVREGRGDRLKEKEYPNLFTGLVWSGEKAVEMGLVDNFGTTASVARDIIKAEDMVDYTSKKLFMERLAERVGASIVSSIRAIIGFDQIME